MKRLYRKEYYSEDYLSEEKKIFDSLDSMINDYHKTKKIIETLPMSLYTPFFEVHKYICDLEAQGKIVTDSSKKISYLEDIVKNDGPEFALVIRFQSKALPGRKYKIGVCVRGTPLLEKRWHYNMRILNKMKNREFS